MLKYREQRRAVCAAVKVHTAHGVDSGFLKNLCCSGAKFEGNRLEPVGSLLSVEMLGTMRKATVVWLNGRSMGLTFEAPLSPLELAAFQRPGSILQVDLHREASKSNGHGFREMR